jgi:hypothetical protein
MGFDSSQNCTFQIFGEKAQAIPSPICDSKLKLRLIIGKIISEAIDLQFY